MRHEGQNISGSLVMMINATNDKDVFFSLSLIVDWENFKIHYVHVTVSEHQPTSQYSRTWTILHHNRVYHIHTKLVNYLSQQFCTADERTKLRHIRIHTFLSLVMPNNKINRQQKESSMCWRIIDFKWTMMEQSIFFLQRCQNIIFHIIERKKNARFSCSD